MFAFVEFRWICILVLENVSCVFDHRTLEAETDTEKRFHLCSCPFDGRYFPLDAPWTKSTRHKNAARGAMNERGWMDLWQCVTGRCTVAAKLHDISPDHPSGYSLLNHWHEQTKERRWETKYRDRSTFSAYNDFQFSIAEQCGMAEWLQDWCVGIFQSGVFAHESDGHFIELPFIPSIRERQSVDRHRQGYRLLLSTCLLSVTLQGLIDVRLSLFSLVRKKSITKVSALKIIILHCNLCTRRRYHV